MVHAELSAVIYDTTDKSMAHWAVHLRVTDDDDITHIIYQANGDEGELMLNVREADPASSRRFRKEIHVSDIDDESAIAEVKGILERQPMKNDIASWNCQDWVMEALEALNDEELIDEYEYLEAKEALEELYNE